LNRLRLFLRAALDVVLCAALTQGVAAAEPELTVVAGAAILLFSWWKLRKAGNDPDKRIRPLWWTFVTMSAMLTVFFIYFVAEARHGFPNFPRHGFWDVSIVLVYENLPWMIAPIVSPIAISTRLAPWIAPRMPMP